MLKYVGLTVRCAAAALSIVATAVSTGWSQDKVIISVDSASATVRPGPTWNPPSSGGTTNTPPVWTPSPVAPYGTTSPSINVPPKTGSSWVPWSPVPVRPKPNSGSSPAVPVPANKLPPSATSPPQNTLPPTAVVPNQPPRTASGFWANDPEFGNEGGGPAFETIGDEMPVPEESDLIPDPLDDDPIIAEPEMPLPEEPEQPVPTDDRPTPLDDPLNDPTSDTDDWPAGDPQPDPAPQDSDTDPSDPQDQEEETLGNEEKSDESNDDNPSDNGKLDEEIVQPPAPRWEINDTPGGKDTPSDTKTPKWETNSNSPTDSPYRAPGGNPSYGDPIPPQPKSPPAGSSSPSPGKATPASAPSNWPANSNQKAADKAGNAVNSHITSGVLDHKTNGAGGLLEKFDDVNKIDQAGKGLDKANEIQAEIDLLKKKHEFIQENIDEIKKHQNAGTSTPEMDKLKSELEKAKQTNRIELLQKITTQTYESLKAATE